MRRGVTSARDAIAFLFLLFLETANGRFGAIGFGLGGDARWLVLGSDVPTTLIFKLGSAVHSSVSAKPGLIISGVQCFKVATQQ